APDRTFGPGDRAPFDVPDMTLNALDLDDSDRLYAADTSGLNLNSSRILVFNNASTADGQHDADRTITSASWTVIEDLVVDGNVLFVADSTASVKIFDDADMLDGVVLPDRTLTVNVNLPEIDGIVVHSDGTGFLADRANHAIYVYEDIAGRTG